MKEKIKCTHEKQKEGSNFIPAAKKALVEASKEAFLPDVSLGMQACSERMKKALEKKEENQEK